MPVPPSQRAITAGRLAGRDAVADAGESRGCCFSAWGHFWGSFSEVDIPACDAGGRNLMPVNQFRTAAKVGSTPSLILRHCTPTIRNAWTFLTDVSPN